MIRNAAGRLKIRTKMLITIFVMAVISLSLFRFLWVHQADAAELLEKAGLVTWLNLDGYIGEMERAARDYTVPDSEDDGDAVKAIEPFLEQFTDEYTGISIYGLDDGLYRCGKSPAVLNQFLFGSILSNSQLILGEIQGDYPIEFANGTYDVVYYSYTRSRFTYPYLAVSVILCVSVFLSGVLVFVGRMLKRVTSVKDAIVRMATGDLLSPVPPCGGDEIGVVASELDTLRKTLEENIRRENESRQANRDLITAVSHDLRTPLTVLNGYLEVLKLKRANAEQRELYIDRCLKKTGEIKALTDRMFEYAQVYEVDESAELVPIPLQAVGECVRENCDFIRIAGFKVSEEISHMDGLMYGDEIMIRRIFSNLFSNILKYGDKKEEVSVHLYPERGKLRIKITNSIKQDVSGEESSRIGLRSVKRMIQMHQGELYTFVETNIYTVQIAFDIFHKYSG